MPFPRWLQGSYGTQSQQQNPHVLAAACGFPTDIPAGIMGDRAHAVTQSQVLHEQVLRTLAAGLQGKGLIGIWTLCRGAAAKGTSLGTAWKSCCQKTGTPEQYRCLEQMAGHSHPEIEKITFPVQCRDRNLQEANSSSLSISPVYSCNVYICQIGLAPLSGLHLATDTMKCPQHKS